MQICERSVRLKKPVETNVVARSYHCRNASDRRLSTHDCIRWDDVDELDFALSKHPSVQAW